MEIEEAKRRARKGPLLLLGRRAFAVIIGLLSTITIARLVSPREFGLATMSAVILSFAQVFRDFGLTNAVLRKGTISEAEMSFIFWFNTATTLTLSVLIAASAPFVAAFYGEPVVKWVVLVSVFSFLSGGLALQHRALMNRELRFGEMALIDSAALLIGYLVTLGLALLWHDVWAIVIGTLVQSVTGSVLNITRSGWRPGRPAIHEDVRELLKFGANSSIFSIAVFFSGNAAPLIIGHVLGSSALGHFNRAQALFTIPTVNVIQPITQATMPLLTRLRAVPSEYRASYLSLVTKICVVLMPASVLITFSAVPLTDVLLGRQWHDAGLVLSALAPCLAFVGLGYSIADLFVTQNRSAELRTLGLFEMAIRLLCILSGVHFGLVPAAIGFSISTTIIALLRMSVAGRNGPVTTPDQVRAALPGIPLGIGALLGVGLADLTIREFSLGQLPALALLLSIGLLVALIAGSSVRASRRALVELSGMFGAHKVRDLLMRRRELGATLEGPTTLE